jgi:hypothetical protein
MLAKVKSFDAQNGHLPLKIGGALLGSAIVTAIVFVVISALADDEEFAVSEFDETPPTDEID